MVRRARVLLAVALTAALTVAFQSPSSATSAQPVQAFYTPSGPYPTTTGTVTVDGTVAYDLFYPAHYDGLHFLSPVVTWGNGTGAGPDDYTTLLTHFASYGFTVIASTLTNTGSGREIDAAAHYLLAQDSTPGNVFFGHLDVHDVAAVGHSQGATGATRAATSDPDVITTLMTFSLPAQIWSLPNPDCATAADCTPHPGLVRHPVFFVSTHGPEDAFISSPGVDHAYLARVPGHGVSGIITTSGGKTADHSTPEDQSSGGDPTGVLGYATAWLEAQLRHNVYAATAFWGPHPEILSNPDWPGSEVK
ncbi:MAG TPA: hypothetical protein VL961_02580 [Acidimicrobiales bacterium]|nr:hypothetical protein [Acidimicrobiales bacterium]